MSAKARYRRHDRRRAKQTGWRRMGRVLPTGRRRTVAAAGSTARVRQRGLVAVLGTPAAVHTEGTVLMLTIEQSADAFYPGLDGTFLDVRVYGDLIAHVYLGKQSFALAYTEANGDCVDADTAELDGRTYFATKGATWEEYEAALKPWLQLRTGKPQGTA